MISYTSLLLPMVFFHLTSISARSIGRDNVQPKISSICRQWTTDIGNTWSYGIDPPQAHWFGAMCPTTDGKSWVLSRIDLNSCISLQDNQIQKYPTGNGKLWMDYNDCDIAAPRWKTVATTNSSTAPYTNSTTGPYTNSTTGLTNSTAVTREKAVRLPMTKVNPGVITEDKSITLTCNCPTSNTKSSIDLSKL